MNDLIDELANLKTNIEYMEIEKEELRVAVDRLHGRGLAQLDISKCELLEKELRDALLAVESRKVS